MTQGSPSPPVSLETWCSDGDHKTRVLLGTGPGLWAVRLVTPKSLVGSEPVSREVRRVVLDFG